MAGAAMDKDQIRLLLGQSYYPFSMPFDEAHQILLNKLCGTLVPRLLPLLSDPSPKIRAAAIEVLTRHRPFEKHVALAIAPLIRDPDGLVMLTSTDRLGEFPDSMVSPFLSDAYQMVFDHQDDEDVVPALAAMRLCLRKGYQDYKDVFMPMVLSGLQFYEQGLEHYLLITTLHELGMAPDE